MKRCKRLLSVMLAFCMMLFMALPVRADDSEVVNEMRNGVVQVGLYYVDNGGTYHYIQSGSGFLINEQTLLTNQHVVTMTDETKTAASEMFNVDFVNDSKLDIRVAVNVTRDVLVDATVLQSSAEMDVAVVELNDPIYDRTPLELGDSSTVTESTRVYALGFPVVPELVQDVQYYTYKDVTVTSDIVSKKVEMNATPFIQHGAKISSGNSGGPLVQVGSDGVGTVVGINTSRVSEEVESGYYYAMEINDVKSLLNALGVSYNTSTDGIETNNTTGTDEENTDTTDGTTGEDTEVPEPTVDTTDLEAAISEAQDKQNDGTTYTEDSLKALDDAIENANTVLDDTAATQSQVDQATDEVESATDALEEEAGMNWLVWVIVGVILLIVIAVVIVLVVTSSNKNKKAAADREREMRQRIEQQRANNQTSQKTVAGHVNIPSPSEGAGETSVLGEGRGETTVLNAGAQANAYMIRKKTNERVTVSGPSFTIGKERSRVNYCISDNTSVSRCHARIMRKGAQYFVTDMNSTNYTFVNGVKVMPGQEVQLNNGDIVRFADEDFEFHTN